LPDLSRRVAVRTVVFALAMAVIVPLSARSATPLPAETKRLLDAATTPLSLVDRGAPGRNASAALSLQEIASPISVEALEPASAGQPTSVNPVVTFGAASVAQAPVTIVPPPSNGTSVSGRATWYCCTAGYRGMAVVALPGALGGHYDPPPAARFVTVCADRCAQLPVVDYCDCYWGTTDQKVADLSPEAWAAITSANRDVVGVVNVTITFAGS
jgi:hypothetical protein